MPKRRVTLTIDPDIYENAQNLVGHIPGLSVSSLFELLLGQFIQKMAPVLNAALSGDAAAQIEAFKRFHGESHTDLALEFADVIRMIQEKEAKSLATK
jgi:antitoxin component of RelBE/YafQ-DinJ toxin-antitoxin module